MLRKLGSLFFDFVGYLHLCNYFDLLIAIAADFFKRKKHCNDFAGMITEAVINIFKYHNYIFKQ